MRWVWRTLICFCILIAVWFITLLIFRQQIGRYLVKRTVMGLSRAINGKVSYEAIKGDIFSYPEIVNLQVISGVDTILIDRLLVRYNLRALLRRKIVLDDVKIFEPDVRIVPVTSEKVSSEKIRLKFPDVSVQRLEIYNGQVSLNRQVRADSIKLSLSLNAAGPGLWARLDSFQCRLVAEQFTVKDLKATVVLNNDSLRINNLLLLSRASKIKGDFTFNFKTRAIEINQAELGMDMQEIFKIPGRLKLKGWGRKSSAEIEAEAAGQAEEMIFHQIRLPILSGRFKISDSTFILNITGSDTELGRAEIDASLTLSNFTVNARIVIDTIPVNRFITTLPEFTLCASIEVSGRLGSLAGLLRIPQKVGWGDSVNIGLRGSAKELGVDTFTAIVDYRHQGAELRELVLAGPAGKFHFEGRAKKGLLNAACLMSDFDLGVAARFLKMNLSGRANGALQLIMSADSWVFNGLVRIEGFGTNGVEVTNGLVQAALVGKDGRPLGLHSQISGRIAIGGEGVKVLGQEWNWAQFVWTGPEFDFSFERDSIRLSALGDITFEPAGVKTIIRNLQLVQSADTVALVDSCEIVLNGDTFDITGLKLNVAEGRVELNFKSVPGSSPDISFKASAVNLSKIARIAGLKLGIQGKAELKVNGKDTLAAELSITDLNLPSAELYLKQLTGALVLTRNNIIINCIKFVHNIDTSSVSGTIVYNIQPRFHINQADLKLNIADPGSWVLMVTRPYVEVREGQIYANLQVSWKPDELNFNGRARVNDGMMYVPSVAAQVERIQAELTFRKDRVVLEKMSGITTRGILIAEGFAQLNSSWLCESLRYQTHFTGVSAIPLQSVYAIGSGDITVSWRMGELALISGEAKIEDGLATIGFGNGQPAGGKTEDNSVNYDLHIIGERGIWLRNPQADIELGVDLNIRKFGDDVLYSGEMVSHQGVIYYLDHTLRLTEGKLTFDNVSSFNPQLHLIAEVSVPGKRNNGPDKIILQVTGSLQEPAFVFTSEPPVWDETQIISYLSLNVTMDELSALEQKELLSRLLANRVLSYFQTQVSKRVRNYISLDYLELETGITGQQGAKVTVGKYVTRNLYISYTQNFTEEFQPAFRIEYYLNRRNELIAERSADGRYSFRYRFKIRF